MKSVNNLNNTVPLRYLVLAGILCLALVAPFYSFAAPKENKGGNGNGKAYGHLVASPFADRFDELKDQFDWLPPGIQKLVDRRHHPNPPATDSDPELTDSDVDTATSSVTIAFDFDKDVKATLYVSTTSGFDTDDSDVDVIEHNNFSDEHTFQIDNLDEDTTYYFKIEFTDKDNNEVMSSQMSFITDDESGETDTTAPSIIDIDTDAGTSTVDIDVEFDEAAQVRLLISDETGFNAGDAGVIKINHANFVSEHSFSVSELENDTQYYFRLQSRDAAGNTKLSDQMTFTTLEIDDEDTTGPVISNVIGEAATTSITGSWTTNEPATSAIYTSVNAGFDLDDAGVIITENNTLKTNHELTITGLTASTTYYHRIVVEDEAGNQTVSGQYLLGTN